MHCNHLNIVLYNTAFGNEWESIKSLMLTTLSLKSGFTNIVLLVLFLCLLWVHWVHPCWLCTVKAFYLRHEFYAFNTTVNKFDVMCDSKYA